MIYESDTYYHFNRLAPSYIATSGIMNLAQDKACFWLLDVIASYARHPAITNGDYFKTAKVMINRNGVGCIFTIEDEISGELIRQDIEYTDLKDDLKIWLITDDDRTTVLLPSEY